jgi:hypothetical protein
MQISTIDDPDVGIRRHTVTGEIIFPVLMEELESIYSDPKFQADQSSLWDLRKASTKRFTAPEVRKVVSLVSRYWGAEGSPRSALVVSTDLDFGMARMYEMLLEAEMGPSVKVFRDIEAAELWVTTGESSAG